jgi:hypothetical protein
MSCHRIICFYQQTPTKFHKNNFYIAHFYTALQTDSLLTMIFLSKLLFMFFCKVFFNHSTLFYSELQHKSYVTFCIMQRFLHCLAIFILCNFYKVAHFAISAFYITVFAAIMMICTIYQLYTICCKVNNCGSLSFSCSSLQLATFYKSIVIITFNFKCIYL